jgi:hypothetical protein
MTRAQQRVVALSIARYQLRQLHVNLLEASAQDAHDVLDDYARRYPELVVSQWYRTASENELSSFYRDWRRWQKQQRRLLGDR